MISTMRSGALVALVLCGMTWPVAEARAAASGPEGPWLEATSGTQGLVTLSSSYTDINGFLGARYRIADAWQLGGRAAFRYQNSNSASSTAFQLLVGPTFNLDLDGGDGWIKNAFFASAWVGFTTGNTMFNSVVVNANTQLTFGGQLGKRFALSDAVSYVPSVGVFKQAHFDATFLLEPIALSVFF